MDGTLCMSTPFSFNAPDVTCACGMMVPISGVPACCSDGVGARVSRERAVVIGSGDDTSVWANEMGDVISVRRCSRGLRAVMRAA